jgi:hypothetical protein
MRFTSKCRFIVAGVLLVSSNANADLIDMPAPRLSPIYIFDPMSIVWNKGTGTTSNDLTDKIKDFCQGKCAATVFIGRELATGLSYVDGMKPPFVPPWRYQYGDSGIVGGALSRSIFEIGNLYATEIEGGLAQRFGSLHETETWIALYARWKYFPWNNYLLTSIAVSTGLSYASAVTPYEASEAPDKKGQRLLHYFSPEITFARPSQPDTELVIRFHHRSGGGSVYGNNLPLYGSIFHGADGGMHYLTFGLRQHF